MSLFVIVTKNKRTGSEYIADRNPEGYDELSHAQRDAAAVLEEHGPDVWEIYVGRVERVEET